MTGTCFSRRYASPSHSSSALEQAYAHREWVVGPSWRSSSSVNGILVDLP